MTSARRNELGVPPLLRLLQRGVMPASGSLDECGTAELSRSDQTLHDP